MEYFSIFLGEYRNFASFLLNEITFNTSKWYINYFYALTFISLFAYSLELLFPWRKDQKKIRHDFFQDLFYMYFNFFIFNLIFFSPFSSLAKEIATSFNFNKLVLFKSHELPYFAQILVFFIILDFVQWATHVALHRFNFLWTFHKVHHSIKEMGFAGHLRYHWMENVIYTPVKYTAITIIGGFEPSNVFAFYYINIMIGHLNHSNVRITYGPLKYIFNNPVMHLWHHAEYIKGKPYGVNFGISLSIWDFIFKTSYMESNNRDIKLGFKGLDKFPKTLFGQMVYPFFK